MNNSNNDSKKKVVSTVRDAIVRAAKEAALLKQQSMDMAGKVKKGWNDSEPQRSKAKSDIQKAGNSVVDFAKDVAQGVKEGIAEVKKSSGK